MKLKKTYRFATLTALYISLCMTLLMSIFLHNSATLSATFLLYIFACTYISSFVFIQFRLEHFIYTRIKKIYNDLAALESVNLSRDTITADMKTLTQDIDQFTKNKKIEIQTLKVREAYRKEFFGNISHELKTPLFTVQSYILTLLNGAINDDTVKEKYLHRANKGVERLCYIVEDLDMITKLEIGGLRLKKETFDIVALIQSVFEMSEISAQKKKITLTFDALYNKPILVTADKDRIQQVISNLIINSIKYGCEKGTTEISIESIVKDKVIIRLTDNGEGVSEDHLPRLFERFYRVDKSGARSEGGSGLGLAIVKLIIEAHNEKIYVESEYNVGSEFSFTLEKAQE